MSLAHTLALLALIASLAYAVFRLRRPLPPLPPPSPAAGQAAPSMPTQGAAIGWEDELRAQLRAVPRGRVVTFAYLAGKIGLEVTVLTVARQVRSYQEEKRTPWWRAVRREGQRGVVPASALGAQQRTLLEKEGVIFQEGTFHFTDYEWQP